MFFWFGVWGFGALKVFRLGSQGLNLGRFGVLRVEGLADFSFGGSKNSLRQNTCMQDVWFFVGFRFKVLGFEVLLSGSSQVTQTAKIRAGLHAGVGGLSGFLTGRASIVQGFRVKGLGLRALDFRALD